MPSTEVLQALEELHKELNKLEPAIKHVETAVEITNVVKSIPEKHNELIEKIKNEYGVLIKKIEDTNNDIYQKILISNENVNNEIHIALNTVKDCIESLYSMKEMVREYYEHIKMINFPERLDKLDATVSSINIGIQNLQTLIMNYEKNTTDSFAELKKNINNHKYYFLLILVLVIIAIIKLFMI